MYEDYKANANIIASARLLAEKYPSLVSSFLDTLEECRRIEYERYVEHSYLRDDVRLEELCMKLAIAISELADELGSDFIYVPYRMHYKIRQAYVSRPNETVNFLKPLTK